MSRADFDRNLAALAKRHPALARQVADAALGAVELVEGPRGATVYREQGVLFGSAYDPGRDGERLAAQMAEASADLLVAVGIGLGDQLDFYLENHPVPTIVYEPSLARMKAALMRHPVANLLAQHRDLYFACDLDQLTGMLAARYVSGLCIRVFPHPAVLRVDPGCVAEAVERVKRVKDAADVRIQTSVAQLMPWAWITAGNGRRIAESADFGRLTGAFRGKPAVIAAAGPSLDKQLPLLREYRDQIVLIAIGQTLKALRRAGLEPDLVHILESQDVSQQLTGAGETRDLCVALTPDAHGALFDVPVRALFTATTGGSAMGTWIARATGETRFTMGGGTVAQGAVGLAVLLGCNPIHLIGQDLAFTDGRVYATGTAYDFVGVEVGEDGAVALTAMDRKAALLKNARRNHSGDKVAKGKVIWVEGWNEGERVPTLRAYATFIEQYREIGIGLARHGIRVVNCTEGGARIPMIDHRPFREALEESCDGPLDVRATLLASYDARPRRTLDDYREALRIARRRLEALEGEVDRARDAEQRAVDRLAHARSDQQRLEILRSVARGEKKIRRELERAPWLDALVQPEIYAAMAAQGKSDYRGASIDAIMAEARFLIDAVGRGAERARDWFARFEASFEEEAEKTAGEVVAAVALRESDGRVAAMPALQA